MDLDLNNIHSDEKLEYESDDVTEMNNDKEPVVNQSTSETEFIPKKGMLFETLEERQSLWEKYALASGFGTKIRSTSAKQGCIPRHRMYMCSKEGEKYSKKGDPLASKPRADIRCSCPARMSMSLIKDMQKYQVASFISDHNHILEDKRTTHLFRSHKSIDKVKAITIDLAHGGLGLKKIHRLVSLEAGGSEKVGFTKEEIKSYLRSQKIKDVGMEELHSIQTYFAEQSRKPPSFFHDYQVDQDGLLTKKIWADSKMILNYEAFGDVVSVDTNFGTNKLIRPLAIFASFNNHRQIVIFGFGLLYDETALSFGWVMKTFLQCHKEKQPCLIYTDQERAMTVAIRVVMPETCHTLCTWDVSENAMTNLRGGLQDKCLSFMIDFHKCMKNYGDVSEFEKKWQDLLSTYGPFENDSKKWIDEFYKKKNNGVWLT